MLVTLTYSYRLELVAKLKLVVGFYQVTLHAPSAETHHCIPRRAALQRIAGPRVAQHCDASLSLPACRYLQVVIELPVAYDVDLAVE